MRLLRHVTRPAKLLPILSLNKLDRAAGLDATPKTFLCIHQVKDPPPPLPSTPLHHHPFRSVQYLKRDLLLFSDVTHLSRKTVLDN